MYHRASGDAASPGFLESSALELLAMPSSSYVLQDSHCHDLSVRLHESAIRMSCPVSARDLVSGALEKCPFLAQVASNNGEGFARRVACKPTVPAALPPGTRQPLFEESVTDFQAALRLFHGPSGLVPLQRLFGKQPDHAACPFAGLRSEGRKLAEEAVQSAERRDSPPFTHVPLTTAAPFATISIPFFNFLPGPGDFLKRNRRQARKNRKPTNGDKQPKPTSGLEGPHATSGSSGTKTVSKGAPPRPIVVKRQNATPAPESGKCPLRNWPVLGGLIPLTAKGDLACPQAIIAMRAAVARLKPVRELRPQALPVKLIAIGITGMLANVPFGMWREHLPKFSPGWFVAVHVTVPFIAVLRKAVVMPKWAILLTVAAAVGGQLVGGRVERYRLKCMAQEREQGDERLKVKPQHGQAAAGQATKELLEHCSRSALVAPGLPLAAGFMHHGSRLVPAG